ncbi:MAG: NADH-quinone oxidoreductase subunit NuoK [Deltaproteobacteria bacterium]|nr:NADH-quinone oxidoreductase subunit NuoK [Deltaproteobacteria bacterium]
MTGSIPLSHILTLSAVLFGIGVCGFMVRRNALIVLMSIELMLNAASLSFMGASRFLLDMSGHVYVLIIITVAAAEAGVGLAIAVLLRRVLGTVNVDEAKELKG